jgi:undecaprenyl diphosphate synthase
MSNLEKVDLNKLPSHIAIIMDGNGRWAKSKGLPRVMGHKAGVKSVRAVSEASAELGIKYLTLYAFSTENWNRPVLEVNALMNLLVSTIDKETKTLMKNNIRLQTIGNIEALPKKSYDSLLKAMEITKNNNRMTLVLALNYSGRWDILNATKKMIENADGSKPDFDDFKSNLSTSFMPDPELIIRTSGELRISNFLLWELAYSEFYFTDEKWPQFDKESLYMAIIDFQTRERRFGKTSDQLDN